MIPVLRARKGFRGREEIVRWVSISRLLGWGWRVRLLGGRRQVFTSRRPSLEIRGYWEASGSS
jgi:hypothetical protein